MLSERNDGASISEVCGIYLGGFMKNVMRVFSVVLLVMVGTVFAVGPAGLIVTLFKNGNVSGIVTSTEFWLWIILAYYFIATFISIDKIIGGIYMGQLGIIVVYVVALGALMYFFAIKPQKKQQKEQQQLMDSMEIGDYVLTTSGFYGVILDITEDDVIVEFGNNKNCRITMQKKAIAQVEKPASSEE